MMNKRKTGCHYETAACSYLRMCGFRLLERNYRCSRGEIDIIAEELGCICFIEVKYRSSDRFGLPAEAVSKKKQKTILAVSRHYICEKRMFCRQIRYDVIEILDGRIRLLRDCFGGY